MSNLTPAKIVEINEFAEIEAQADYFRCAPPEFSRPFRLEVDRIGSVCVTTIPEADNLRYNRILGLGMSEPLTESMLDEAIAVFQNTGCKNYMARVSTLALPARIPEWLASRGFKPRRNWAKMYRGNEPAPLVSTDLRVERIGKYQANAYANLVLSVFGMTPVYRPLIKGSVGKPGWHHYLAFAEEKPVAAAAMFITGDVAWLGFAGTLITHRRRGGQSAMIARRIEDGLALGCKWFASETYEDTPEHPKPTYHNLLRKGFKLAYLQRCYYHQSPMSPVKKVRHALFISAYGLRFELQRLMQQGKNANY